MDKDTADDKLERCWQDIIIHWRFAYATNYATQRNLHQFHAIIKPKPKTEIKYCINKNLDFTITLR
jgi:hypothetical protein